MAQKIFILLPDGIGLRNFAYTDFYKIGQAQGYDITFWNNTPFNLTALGFDEIRVPRPKHHPLTEIVKNAITEIELKQNIKNANDDVYASYRFPKSYKNFKSGVKSLMAAWLSFWDNSQKGLDQLRAQLKKQERNTEYYQKCRAILQREKPAFVFCTNQRITQAVAPLLAAQDLGIPTATFIFSWDNLPKGTKIVETDYYFVWSEHMKSELRYYYPQINNTRIFVTGTPQFESHFNPDFLKTRDAFFTQYGLDLDKRYICFSGDDVTTSPNDPQYLSDVADAVRELNAKGHHLGIVFRRCPADFSDRYDPILAANKDIITAIAPEWKKVSAEWSAILPTKEDLVLQMNTIAHTELVINLGSSMVFDYAAHNKPCGFINYDMPNKKAPGWSVKKIYNFIHFRSMPDRKAVFWLNDPKEIAAQVAGALGNSSEYVAHAQDWFSKITLHPPQEASARIWGSISGILKKN